LQNEADSKNNIAEIASAIKSAFADRKAELEIEKMQEEARKAKEA